MVGDEEEREREEELLRRQQRRVEARPRLLVADRREVRAPSLGPVVDEPERPRLEVACLQEEREAPRVEERRPVQQRERHDRAEAEGGPPDADGAHDGGEHEQRRELGARVVHGARKAVVQHMEGLVLDRERSAGGDVRRAAERELRGQVVADAPRLDREEERGAERGAAQRRDEGGEQPRLGEQRRDERRHGGEEEEAVQRAVHGREEERRRAGGAGEEAAAVGEGAEEGERVQRVRDVVKVELCQVEADVAVEEAEEARGAEADAEAVRLPARRHLRRPHR